MKDYFSQQFRNLRRYSLQTEEDANKIVTKDNACIKVTKYSTGACDEVAYMRSMESLIKELKKPQPQKEIIEKIMRLTFENRRKKINGALVKTTELLDMYPFFRIKRWVSKLCS